MRMSQREVSDSPVPKWVEAGQPFDGEFAAMGSSGAQMRELDEAELAIAHQLNGALTALLLYMGELKQHSHRLTQGPDDRICLQAVIENAVAQTERVCAILKRIASRREGPDAVPARVEWRADGSTAPRVMLSPASCHKPLTKREGEVLRLVSEGCSSKQGALRMRISPRTFESHRAEVMRKLGARNTAELVRAALSHARAM
jgi:DNA-binding CsgD family transcriptional regulator